MRCEGVASGFVSNRKWNVTRKHDNHMHITWVYVWSAHSLASSTMPATVCVCVCVCVTVKLGARAVVTGRAV